MIDEAGRRLLVSRNGVVLGASAGTAPPPAAEIAKVTAAATTNRQARQLLGIAAEYLKRGYAIVDTVPSNMWFGVLRWARYFDGSADLAKRMRQLLDQNNAFAQKVYKQLPNDDAPVLPAHKNQVKVALSQASSNLQLISSAANNIHQSFIDDMVDALDGWVNSHTPGGLPKIPKDVSRVVIYVAVGAAALTTVFIVAKLVHTIALGRANDALGAAEEEALAIADAQRRKRQSRSVLSIA
jgi:hypothetical protein